MRDHSSRLTPGPSDLPDDLRADARRNRERVLHAARELFAARGVEVPMATIARRAGVGVATLYRRFPTREALIVEVFTEQGNACADVVDRSLADPDPWRAFAGLLERITAMQVADRGFSAAVLHAFPDKIDVEGPRLRAEEGVSRIIGRAKAAGVLRRDFDRTDLTLVFMAVDGVHTDMTENAAAAAQRLLAHFLRSFRTDAVPSTPLPPASPVGLYPHGFQGLGATDGATSTKPTGRPSAPSGAHTRATPRTT